MSERDISDIERLFPTLISKLKLLDSELPLKSVAILLATPFTFVRVSFVQKQYDPQLTIDYLLNESAPSGGNHTRAPSYQVHQNH